MWAACSGDNTGAGFADLPLCGTAPFVSVEVGAAALCATHADGCVECAVLAASWVVDIGEQTPPDRELLGVSMSDGCHHAYEVFCQSPQYGACGLLADGEARCWGREYTYPKEASPGYTLTSVSVGYQHACGLDAGGGVECWGDCDNDSCVASPGPFTQLRSGHDFTCGLDAAGRVSCWGYDSASFGAPSDEWPAPLEAWGAGPFVQLFAVPAGPCGMTAAGDVTCFRYEYEVVDDAVPAPPGASSSFVAVPDHLDLDSTGVCALTETGALTCSELGFGLPIGKLAGYTFTQLSASGDRLCGVTTDGEIVCAIYTESWAYCPFCRELVPDE